MRRMEGQASERDQGPRKEARQQTREQKQTLEDL
jgi:hypothetical protein